MKMQKPDLIIKYDHYWNKNSAEHAIYKMRVFLLASKFWSFSQVLYRVMRTRFRKSRTLHIAKRLAPSKKTTDTMTKLIYTTLFLSISLIVKSQNYCDFIMNVQNYQDSVKLKHVGEYEIIDSATFDINTFLTFFNNIEFEKNYRISVCFFDDFLNGNPYIYAIKNDQELKDKNKKSMYNYLNKPELRAKNHIVPKDSKKGFLQYLFFYEFGEQFALKWHSYYNEKRIICSSDKLDSVINDLETSEMFSADSLGLIKLKEVSPEIAIESNDKYYIISWLENRTHSGIFKCTYQISKKRPNKIDRIKEEKLLDIYMNFIY